MHRNNLLHLLHDYHPDNEVEIKYKKDIIDFVIANENCFERSNVAGHMTASAWLINQTGDKVLLMHHRKLNEWLQFGGHADGDNDLLRVAIKEAQEESGILDIKPVMNEIFDIDIHFNEKINDIEAHIHYDIRFLLQLQKDDKEKKNEESIALNWFTKDLEKLPNKKLSIMRMFKKWLLFDNIT